MATTETLLASEIRSKRPERRFDSVPFAVSTALTTVALIIHGYHPYAEDGGLYLAGIFKLVHPSLYPTWTGFVTAQSRFSLFARIIASFVRISGISVMDCIFGTYVLSIWATLFAAWHIVVRCYRSREACFAAVSILALCLTAPIAGTSLILMDPYVTARSMSTPCSLFAIVGALDSIWNFKQTGRLRYGSVARLGISLLLAAIMHPLMTAYAAGCIILLVCSSITNLKARLSAFGVVAMFAIAIALLLNLVAPPQPAGYVQVALTRYYWFLCAWHWYEIVGVIAPLFLLFVVVRLRGINERGRWLAQMAIAAGLLGLLVALLFARQSLGSYFVAMLQPLRIFQMVYLVMILLVGAALAGPLLKRHFLRWSTMMLALGGLMFFVQMQIFPHSSHLEFPWISPQNCWQRGFLWIRNNTPEDALFALDANYITSADEDAQNFRAIAERSALPDYAKDGGIAAIEPDLTSNWVAGERIQTDLATSTDAERRSKLALAHVQWLVLPSGSTTAFPCLYQNEAMKVCRIPDR